MKAFLRKLVKRLIPFPGVRTDLRSTESSLRRAFYGLRKALFTRRSSSGSDRHGLRLNVGCGDLVFPGWTNVDENPIEGVDYLDARNGLPYRDSTVVHIHCEHFLEHLEYSEATGILSEFCRVLKPDGTLRLIVPDAEKYCRAYVNNDSDYFKRLENLGGTLTPFETPMQIINQTFRMGGDHKFAWDYDTLSRALQSAGFCNVYRSEKGDILAEYDIDGTDWWREVESLYVNASKSRLSAD